MFLITKIPLFIGLSDKMYSGRSLPLFLPHIKSVYVRLNRYMEDLPESSAGIGGRTPATQLTGKPVN